MFGSADIAEWLVSEASRRRLPPGRSRPGHRCIGRGDCEQSIEVGVDPKTGSDGLGQYLDSRDFFADEAIPQSGFHSGRMPRFNVRQHLLVLR